MAGIDPLSCTLVTQCVNFHGHQLLKQLTSSHPKDFETLNLKEVDYKVYKARIPEISKQPSVTRNELINFISDKCPSLFVPRETESLKGGDDDYGIRDRSSNLPPLEYFMRVMSHLKRDMFFKTVQRGDVLYVRVTSYVHDLLCTVKVQAAVGTTVRDLFDTDIKAHLRLEDTDPEPADRDDLGRWMLRTRLCVEVLEVDASDNYLLVGTKGVAIHSHLKDKVKLGKATLSNRPPILSEMENRSIKSYSQALEKLVTFNNPRSIRHLAGKFNLNLYSHTSLMDSLKHKFSEREMYKSVRKAQMSRWAHKSVADGVVFFKRGQHEEAFQCLNKALQIDTENVEAFVAKGALLANFGSLEKAVENFEEALKYNPTHNNAQKYICETLVELGKQLEEENKIEEAEKNFKKCLSINPNHAAGKEALRKITQKNEDRSEIVQDVLQDLIDIEEEFNSRKRHRTSSTSKSSPSAKREARGSEIKEPAPAPEPSTRPRSRSKSLSPLSKKLQMQEGKWLPPTTINTTSSFMGPNLAVPPPTVDLAVPPPTINANYNYPPPGWPPTTMVTAPPVTTMYPPPTAYTMLPQGPAVSSSTYSSREDEEYKARVDQFLKNLEEDRSVEKKDRSKKKHSRGREPRSQKKHKDSHKKRNRSISSSSVSRSSSYSSRSSSSSSNTSSSSTSSSSSHSSSGSPVDTKKKKHRKHKKQKKPSKKEKKKPEKHVKKETVKEKPKSNVPPVSSVEDDPIPGLESLNEKLTAYYKKVEESQREQPVRKKRPEEKEVLVKEREKRSKEKETLAKEREKRPKEKEVLAKEREKMSKEKMDQVKVRSSDNSDTITQMMNVMKSYEQGFRLTSKTKVGTSSALPTKGVHPAFQESDEDDILDQPASNTVNKKQQAEDEKDTTGGSEFTRSTVLDQGDSTVIKKGSQSSASQESVTKDHSRSRSKSHSKSRSRSLSRSHSRSASRSSFRRYSKSQSRDRFRSYSKSQSRERSRSPFRHHSRSRSRSQSRSYYKIRYKDGRPHPRGRIHSYQRPRSRDRDDHYHEGFKWHRPYYTNSKSPRHHPNRFRGRGRFGGRRGGASLRGNSRGHQEKKGHHRGRDSPEPLSEQEREMMIQTARKKLEESIKYGAVDPSFWESNSDNLSCTKTSSKLDSSCQRSPKLESSRPKTPSRWEASRHKTPSRWESSRPKTPSRWESSRPKTPSRWESSRPKTPSRWESSRPKTPSRWESSRPKTPSRWESYRPKTPSRWESSRPKTPSRWKFSQPKTPSRWESSQPKTPSRWEPSHPKTPSKWDTSHPKTPSHGASKESKNESYNDNNDNSPYDSSENSPDRTARFGKWDNDEKGKNGESKIGNSLTEMETFIQIAKQKKIEEMKERNKEFLKPNID